MATFDEAIAPQGSLFSAPAFDNGHTPAWAHLDLAWYRRRYAQALQEAGVADADDAAIARFWREQGAALGHVPSSLFDEDFYLARNPDVASGVRDGVFDSGFMHYCESGFRSRAPHWLFSEDEYFRVNPDLSPRSVREAGFANGYDHYLTEGDRAWRVGHPFFDPDLFRAECEAHQLRGAHGHGGFAFFLGTAGAAALRTSWYFDPAWYLAQYPVVAEALARGEYTHPLHHYLTNPTPTAFDPNPFFSEAFYAASNPDVAAIVANGGLRNGYEHFLRFGLNEGRKPVEHWDLAAYRVRPDVVRAVRRGVFRDIFAHWVATSTQGTPEDAAQDAPPLSPAQHRELLASHARTMLPLLVRGPLDFTVRHAPVVSVIVPSRNDFSILIETLASLYDGGGGRIEVIVTDAESADETGVLDRFFRGVTHRRVSPRDGFGGWWRAGLDHARAPAVLLLRPGARLAYGALDAALARLQDGGVGAVTGQMLRDDLTVGAAGALSAATARLRSMARGRRLSRRRSPFRGCATWLGRVRCWSRRRHCGRPAFRRVSTTRPVWRRPSGWAFRRTASRYAMSHLSSPMKRRRRDIGSIPIRRRGVPRCSASSARCCVIARRRRRNCRSGRGGAGRARGCCSSARPCRRDAGAVCSRGTVT